MYLPEQPLSILSIAAAIALSGCTNEAAPDADQRDGSAASVSASSTMGGDRYDQESVPDKSAAKSADYGAQATAARSDGSDLDARSSSSNEYKGGGEGMDGGAPGSIVAMINATRGFDVDGRVLVIQDDGGLVFDIKLTGLAPGRHGFHIHRNGDCSANATKTGGHFAPNGMPHGGPGDDRHHEGDLGNLEANDNGVVDVRIRHAGNMVLAGENGIRGRALVLHKRPDDFETQPAGDAGEKVACGVIPQTGRSSG